MIHSSCRNVFVGHFDCDEDRHAGAGENKTGNTECKGECPLWPHFVRFLQLGKYCETPWERLVSVVKLVAKVIVGYWHYRPVIAIEVVPAFPHNWWCVSGCGSRDVLAMGRRLKISPALDMRKVKESM